MCEHFLSVACNWCEDCGFKISRTETVAVPFTRKHHPAPSSLLLQDSIQLPLRNEHKYVRIIDSGKRHLLTTYNDLCAEMLRRTVIRLWKGTWWGASKRPLLTVHRSLVRSVIEDGTDAYFSRLHVY